MSAIRCNVGVITLVEKDLDQAKEFYARVLGITPVFADAESATLRFDNTIINLENESAAHDLIAPAAVADQGGGSRVVLTLWVEDVDAACAVLAKRGVTLIYGWLMMPRQAVRARRQDRQAPL